MHDFEGAVQRQKGSSRPLTAPGAPVDSSRDIFIFSIRDPENGPEYSEFLYLCENRSGTKAVAL